MNDDSGTRNFQERFRGPLGGLRLRLRVMGGGSGFLEVRPESLLLERRLSGTT